MMMTKSETIGEDPAQDTPPASGSSGQSSLAPGAILLLDGQRVAVRTLAPAEDGVQQVLSLEPGGVVRLHLLDPARHQVEELGRVSPLWLKRLGEAMHWTRDLLVFHCHRFEDVARLPPAPATDMAQPGGPRLSRGQRFSIAMGSKSWGAVYWGRDAAGHVVACAMGEHWSLIHLDLERYPASLRAEAEADPELVRRIEASLQRLSR